MRCKTIFGALLVSVALCSQGFGFELLDRVLGLNGGGCGECNACAKVACCEKACPKACEPACEKACPKACEPSCDPCCQKALPAVACDPCCKKQHCTPVRDMFDGIADMFTAKAVCMDNGCEVKGCCPEPTCCEKPCKVKKCRKVKACDPCGVACCEKACPKACEPTCEPTCEKVCKPKCHKLYRRPVVELLESLFCCDNGCEVGCEAACATGCDGAAPAKASETAPAKAPEQAAPLPAAPKADPSASIESRGIYQASRSLVRN